MPIGLVVHLHVVLLLVHVLLLGVNLWLWLVERLDLGMLLVGVVLLYWSLHLWFYIKLGSVQ